MQNVIESKRFSAIRKAEAFIFTSPIYPKRPVITLVDRLYFGLSMDRVSG